MGQKVNPIGIRLGITRDWTSKWYAGSKTFASNIHTDFLVRKYLMKKLADASVSRIHIERAARRANITIHTARPGIVIGKKGEDIEKLRTAVAKILGMTMQDVRLNIAEIRKPELDAKLVAEGISQQLEKRVMFRRAMKRAVTNTMRSGALGIKVRISGRLNGSEIARTETNREGGCLCTRSAPTSTTVLPRRRRHTALSASRCGYSKAKSSISRKPRRPRPRPRLLRRPAPRPPMPLRRLRLVEFR